MFCPFCAHEETKVVDSRLVSEGDQIRRRRECLQCQERFTTYEKAELVLPRIIKSDGRRTEFDEEKIRSGMTKALEKRPVSTEAIEAAIQQIVHRLRASGEREISSNLLGDWVMEELLKMDEVAYVRFASVYRGFQDLEEFRSIIQSIKSKVTTQI
ncbi:MAG: transcriptional regulator NrdR [Legionellales bacterium]|nr:transcriptional regulator NrdR [Legionellales bacterium]|tara:strand:+ start:32045 stop:32512 length:468 start_codon:yes stop_codon:yes gene_type:complete